MQQSRSPVKNRESMRESSPPRSASKLSRNSPPPSPGLKATDASPENFKLNPGATQLEWANVDLTAGDLKSSSVCQAQVITGSPTFKNMNKARFKIKAFASVLKERQNSFKSNKSLSSRKERTRKQLSSTKISTTIREKSVDDETAS